MTTPSHTVIGHWCDSCDVVVDEPVTVYECSLCGGRDSERRCDSCNRFAARDRDGLGCPDCFTIVTEIQMVEDHNGEWIPLDRYLPEGNSLADRVASEEASRSANLAAKRSAEEAQLLDRSVIISGDQLRPGHQMVVTDHRGGLGTLNQPSVLSVAELDSDRAVVVTDRYGSATLSVMKLSDTCQVLEPASLESPEPMWTVNWSDTMQSGFSSSNRLEVGVDPIIVDGAAVPAVSVFAVIGNYYVMILATHLRDHAVAVGEAFIQAAEKIAAYNGESLPEPGPTESFSSGFRAESPSRHIRLRIVEPSEWNPVAGVEITSDRQASTITSVQQLISVGTELIRVAPKLLHSRG